LIQALDDITNIDLFGVSHDKATLLVVALLATTLPVHGQDRANAVPDMRVLLDNECVRMQFHDVAVGEKTPMHSHPKYAVYVFNPYKARITLADGTRVLSEHKSGETFWKEPSQHIVENIGNTPIHNLVVELKPGTGCH
jgi:quercetin dioxygenase-like cupin family protein